MFPRMVSVPPRPTVRKVRNVQFMRKKLVFIGGGTRSGKSAFALSLARRLGQRRLFLATAQPGDDEMRQRIERHRRERGPDFHTIEEPLAVAAAIEQHAAA